jgi:hypothetical protein
VEDIRWELQEVHATGDGESISSVYDWSIRCKLLDILEGPSTAQAQEGTADRVGTGSIGASVSLGLIEENWIGTLEQLTPREGATQDKLS